jgi:20S proteasome subunit beta 1
VYGYCDATYQDGWGRDDTVKFVKNSTHALFSLIVIFTMLTCAFPPTALSLAMARDGSSGGVIRMCVITKEGVERLFVPGNELPRFWEGKEVLGKALQLDARAPRPDVAPMAVEA